MNNNNVQLALALPATMLAFYLLINHLALLSDARKNNATINKRISSIIKSTDKNTEVSFEIPVMNKLFLSENKIVKIKRKDNLITITKPKYPDFHFHCLDTMMNYSVAETEDIRARNLSFVDKCDNFKRQGATMFSFTLKEANS